MNNIVTVFGNGVMPCCSWSVVLQADNNVLAKGEEMLPDSQDQKMEIDHIPSSTEKIKRIVLDCWHVVELDSVNDELKACPQCNGPVTELAVPI